MASDKVVLLHNIARTLESFGIDTDTLTSSFIKMNPIISLNSDSKHQLAQHLINYLSDIEYFELVDNEVHKYLLDQLGVTEYYKLADNRNTTIDSDIIMRGTNR